MVQLPDVVAGQRTATIVLPTAYSALSRLSEWVQAIARANRLSDVCAFRLELVLVETVTNVIEHGGNSDPNASIVVQVTCDAGRIVVQSEDTGRPFDPTLVAPPRKPESLDDAPIGGLGIVLMRSYTQAWEYERFEQKNRLRMTIACDG